MTTRRRWISALATVLLSLQGITFLFVAWQGLRDSADPEPVSSVVWVLSFMAFPIVGWLIAIKLPHNPLGWIYLAFPIVVALGVLLQELQALNALGANESTAAVSIIIGSWIFITGFWLILVPGVLLFPDGRLHSYRWRWALWGSVILIATVQVIELFGSERVCIDWSAEVVNECVSSFENPLKLSALGGIGEDINSLLGPVLFLSAIVSLAGLIARFRSSRAEARQQIKWVTLVVVVGIGQLALITLAQEAFSLSLNEWFGTAVYIPVNVGIPIAIGVAILKYRLYDIDRIISRTASYAIVAGVLAAVFVASVALTQQLLPIEGQLGIVASTLVVAALFNPLRVRVQSAVDRRFNRSRYDAQWVVDDFAAHLQDGVDLEHMQAALLNTAEETMQPSHVSLWIRDRGPSRQ
jgi:hypothetical protein